MAVLGLVTKFTMKPIESVSGRRVCGRDERVTRRMMVRLGGQACIKYIQSQLKPVIIHKNERTKSVYSIYMHIICEIQNDLDCMLHVYNIS